MSDQYYNPYDNQPCVCCQNGTITPSDVQIFNFNEQQASDYGKHAKKINTGVFACDCGGYNLKYKDKIIILKKFSDVFTGPDEKCMSAHGCKLIRNNQCPMGADHYEAVKQHRFDLVKENPFYKKGLRFIKSPKVRAILESTGFENRDRKDEGVFSDIAKAREVFEI